MPWFMTPFGPQYVTDTGTVREFQRRDYLELTAQQASDYFAGVSRPTPVSFVTEGELPARMAQAVEDPGSDVAGALRGAFAHLENGVLVIDGDPVGEIVGGGGGSGITPGTVAGQIPVWDGNSYEPQTPADAVAADVPFTPAGRVAATNVQAAIAELDAEKSLLIEAVNTVAASGAAQTLPDVTVATIHDVTLTANCTLTLPTVAAGKSLTVRLTQDATGSRTVTWPATVKWPGGLAPTLSAAAGKQDVISLVSIGGSTWSGFVAGLDIR